MPRSYRQDVDKGYAWVILAGCYLMYFFLVGTLKAYGILFTEIDRYYSVGSGPVSFISSIFLGCLNGLGPFSNYLAVKIGFRKITFAGGLLIGIGYATSFFVGRLEYLFLTLGVIAGLGYGFAFAPCATIISFYFEKRRALANGITASASGMGAIVLPFLYRHLIDTYTLKPALLLLGGTFLNLCVGACCFRQPVLYTQQSERTKDSRKIDTIHLKDDKSCNCGPDFKIILFKNPRFTLYWVAFILASNGYGNSFLLIPTHTWKLGFAKSEVALTISIMGFCEIFARIFIGWIVDKKWIKPKHMFTICFFVSALFAFVTPAFESLEYMCVYAAITGIFPASFWSLVSVLVIDVVGMKDFPSAFGLVLLGLAVGVIICQPSIGSIDDSGIISHIITIYIIIALYIDYHISSDAFALTNAVKSREKATWLKDSTGDWNASFYFTGVLLLLPAIMMLVEPLIIPKESQKHLKDIESKSAEAHLADKNKSTDGIRGEGDVLLNNEKRNKSESGHRQNGDASDALLTTDL